MLKQKTILVTGAAGFIGSRFVETCNTQGISLVSVDRRDYFSNRSEHRSLEFGEIVEINQLQSWLSSPHRPIHAIVHLGAITDTREGNLALLNQYNLNYSKNLWNYATQAEIPLVYASSAATYGDGIDGYDDDESLIHQLKPLNPYGDSKLQFDIWALEEERNHRHPPFWAGFKFFNVYGFGETHKGFMASVVKHSFEEIMSSGQVTLFKSHRDGIPDGFQKRDFVFVEDVVQVLRFSLEKPIRRGIYNLGTGNARTFLDLGKAVFHALKKPESIRYIDTPLSIRDKYQYFTEARMKKLREEGYLKPFTSLEEGVEKTVKRLALHPR